jgi:hypothetical protein
LRRVNARELRVDGSSFPLRLARSAIESDGAPSTLLFVDDSTRCPGLEAQAQKTH